MNKTAIAILLAAASTAASAKDKLIPLPEGAAPTLAGKSLAVVRHPVPDFGAMTAGKAMFGLIGGLSMVSAGNEIISSNHVEDPAELVARELAPAFARRYGMNLESDAPSRVVKETKPAKIAATQSGVDYLLDIRSGTWMFAYYPSDWGHYWVMYSVQVQLIDGKSGQQVANAACTVGNKDDKHPPSRDDMLAGNAQLLKDITQGFGWNCVHVLAGGEFHLAETEISPVPAQYTDVLAKFAAAKPNGSAPTATAVTTEAAAAPAAAPTPAATEAPVAPAAEGDGAADGVTEAGAPAAPAQ